jgi:hypothetical protein
MIGRAFALGFEAGSRRGEATPRQADRLLRGLLRRAPTADELDAFGQGSIDGARGDRFRLELGAALDAQAAGR